MKQCKKLRKLMSGKVLPYQFNYDEGDELDTVKGKEKSFLVVISSYLSRSSL